MPHRRDGQPGIILRGTGRESRRARFQRVRHAIWQATAECNSQLQSSHR